MPGFLDKFKDSGLDQFVQKPGRLWRRYAYGLVKFSWLPLRTLIGG